MKRIVKSGILLAVMAMLLVVLTGCGGNKLIATRETQDETIGAYKETVTIEFKNDKATSIEMAMEFDKEETAKSIYNIYNLGMSMSEDESTQGFDVKQDGKKLVITMDPKSYAESEEISDNELTKDALKAQLEEEGYTVK